MEASKCRQNKHFHDCDCLQCQSRRAFCNCSECIERRTKFSGSSASDRDFSKYPSLQQLIDLEGRGNYYG